MDAALRSRHLKYSSTYRGTDAVSVAELHLSTLEQKAKAEWWQPGTMKDASWDFGSPVPLLTAVNSESHVHLIIGSNPIAAARCMKSLEAGAKPIIIAPETVDLQYTLAERIENGSAQWVRREFQDNDLTTLGREEVDHVVDTVFVTLGANHSLSMY